jgi:quinol monooxygenase YgiN
MAETLHVVAVIPAKSGSEAALGEALAALTAATREEDGCLAYDLFESQSTPGTYVTVEEWRDQAALDGHMAGPAMAQALTAAGEHLDGAPGIHPLTRKA